MGMALLLLHNISFFTPSSSYLYQGFVFPSLTKQKVDGTQLAAGCDDGTVIVWSYPSGDVIFEENKHSTEVDSIAWNPFRQDVLTTCDALVRNVMSMSSC